MDQRLLEDLIADLDRAGTPEDLVMLRGWYLPMLKAAAKDARAEVETLGGCVLRVEIQGLRGIEAAPGSLDAVKTSIAEVALGMAVAGFIANYVGMSRDSAELLNLPVEICRGVTARIHAVLDKEDGR